MKIEVRRTEVGKNGIGGELYLDDDFICYTLELPFINNEEDISAIPLGRYSAKIKPSNSESDQRRIWLNDVEGRTNIQFHIGNYTSNSYNEPGNPHRVGNSADGCILLGRRKANLKTGYIEKSEDAFNLLMSRVDLGKKEPLTVEIIDDHELQLQSVPKFFTPINPKKSVKDALDFEPETGGRLPRYNLNWPSL